MAKGAEGRGRVKDAYHTAWLMYFARVSAYLCANGAYTRGQLGHACHLLVTPPGEAAIYGGSNKTLQRRCTAWIYDATRETDRDENLLASVRDLIFPCVSLGGVAIFTKLTETVIELARIVRIIRARLLSLTTSSTASPFDPFDPVSDPEEF